MVVVPYSLATCRNHEVYCCVVDDGDADTDCIDVDDNADDAAVVHS